MVLSLLVFATALTEKSDLDETVAGLYNVISGPIGAKRDWQKFSSLFADQAQMKVVTKRQEKTALVTLTPKDYVERAGPILETRGFFEKEVSRKSWVYGDMAQVWSTYESRTKADQATPDDRGINTITLAKIEGRWLIVTITWTDEKAAGPLPAEFLP